MALKLRFNPKEMLDNLFGHSGGPVAIDFGTTGIKMLAVQPGTTPALEAIAFDPTPPELRLDVRKRFAHQLERLPRLVKELGLRGRKAVCAIPASQTFCKHLQIERVADVPLLVMAQSVISQQIGCDPSALVYQPLEVGPLPTDAAKSEVICTAVSRELVNLIMSGTRHAKLEIAAVHGEFIATVRGFDYITKRSEDCKIGSLYLDIGESATKVVIAQGTRIVFVRFVETGTRAFDQTLAAKRSCTLEQAAGLRMERSGQLADDPPPVYVPQPVAAASTPQAGLGIFAMMPQDRRKIGARQEAVVEDAPLPELAEQVEILADEVQMCVRYAESVVPGLRIDRLFCMGGGSADKTLCRRVAKTLRIQAQVVDPLARLGRTGQEPTIGLDLARPHPEWSVAVGLCFCPLAI